MRAAIIDDRADDREILFRELDSVLREKGYRVDSIDLFESGEQFLNSFEQGKYDLLFFDIYMEDKDESLMSFSVSPEVFKEVEPGDGVLVVKAGRKVRVMPDPDRKAVMDVSRIRSGV